MNAIEKKNLHYKLSSKKVSSRIFVLLMLFIVACICPCLMYRAVEDVYMVAQPHSFSLHNLGSIQPPRSSLRASSVKVGARPVRLEVPPAKRDLH